jgi:hypothetical protein
MEISPLRYINKVDNRGKNSVEFHENLAKAIDITIDSGYTEYTHVMQSHVL